MSEQIDTAKINFNHRFTTSSPLSEADCLESIDNAVRRCIGVLEALTYSETLNKTNGDEMTYWALHSVILELNDGLAMIDALLAPKLASGAKKFSENPNQV